MKGKAEGGFYSLLDTRSSKISYPLYYVLNWSLQISAIYHNSHPSLNTEIRSTSIGRNLMIARALCLHVAHDMRHELFLGTKLDT